MKKHRHDYYWLGWLKRYDLRVGTEAYLCKCGQVKFRRWKKGKAISYHKLPLRKR